MTYRGRGVALFIALVAIVGSLDAPRAQDREARRDGAGNYVRLAAGEIASGATTVTIADLKGAVPVTAVRIAINRGTCTIDRLVITYTNGQVHYEDRDIVFNDAGRRSAPIDARVDGRRIESVVARIKSGTCDPGIELEVQGAQISTVGIGGPPYAAAKKAGKQRGISQPRAAAPDAEPPLARSERIEPPQVGSGSAAARLNYSEVDIFFGTSRELAAPRTRADVKIASFGTSPHPEGKLTVGKAVVTVPLDNRKAGQINRPEYNVLRLSYEAEDINRHFTIFRVDVLTTEQFMAAAEAAKRTTGNLADHAFVFVHGYNVSFDDALFRGAQLTHDMDFNGLPFVFSWPSRSNLAGYILDRQRAVGAQPALREFIELVRRIMGTGARNIHFIGHSMGSQPLMDALAGYERPAGQSGPLLGQVIFAAADVIRENFRSSTARIARAASGITLYASSKDWALTASGVLNLFEQPVGLIKSGQAPFVGADFDSIDVSALDTDFFARNHSTYGDRGPLIEDMRKLFTEAADAARPPSRRNGGFVEQRLPRNEGIYWRYVTP